MHVYMILYHVHRKREDMYMEWIFCFRKGNRRNTNKIERRTLPSDIQKLKRAKEVQKSMRMLCDSEESGSSSDDKTFVTMRSRQRLDNRRHLKQKADLNGQKEIEEVNLTDSSENEILFDTSANLTSYKQIKQKKSRRDQRIKSIQDRRISKNKISSDSENSSIDLSSNKIKQKRISKSIRTGRNINSCNSINFSDSESDKDVSTTRANISKSLSKNTTQQDRKKDVNSSDAKSTKDKAKKHQDSASESEDEDINYKKQNSKRLSTNRIMSHNNNEEKKRKKKYDKSSKKHLSNIQEDESDASSSKEFQKIKFQKVNHNKYSTRRLANLEIDYTKSPVEENSAIESKENINDQLDMNLDNAKELVSDCKKIVLNLQTYINSVEQLYGKKDEEKFMLKMIKKINKLWPNLQKVQKNLTTFYQFKSSQNKKNSVIRKLPKEVNDEQSSEETSVREKCATSENKICDSGNEQDGSKNVSECDSEIFSGNESRTLQKMQITQDKIDTSNTENNVNVNDTESDDGDKELIDSSRDEDNPDKNNMDLQINLSSSPVLSVSTEKKKRSVERSTKKQLFSKISNNETPLTDKDNDSNDKQAKSDTDVPGSEIETEDSPLRNGNRKMMSQNIGQDDSANTKDIINESMDLFDTSYHDIPKAAEENEAEAQEAAAETNCDDPKSLSKIKPMDISLQGGVLNENDRTALSLCDNEEENLLDQDNQKKLASVSATSEKVDDNLEELDISGKTNTDDIESLDDAEALAKKSLLESDSDLDNILDVNVATKSIEGLITDNVDQPGKSNEAKDDDVDVNSTSTLILSSFLKKINTNVEAKAEVENKKDNQQTDEKSREETGSLNDDAKAEEAAKKALLESNSDSTILSSSDSEENENKKTESNSSRENAKSKQALLASSNTESSSSEPTILNVEIASRLSKKSNNSKRNHELESDGDSIVSTMKKKRLKLNKNHHHDKKLRMFCEVRLKRLSRKDLRRYSHALQKSREYLDQKKFKRYQDFSLKPLLIVLHNLK